MSKSKPNPSDDRADDLSEDDQEGGEPILAFVLLEGESFPFETFIDQLFETAMVDVWAEAFEGPDDGIFRFVLDDESVTVVLLPSQYPLDELEGPMETSLLWPQDDPIERLRKHQTHLLIAVAGGEGAAIRRRMLLTAVTGLAAGQQGAMAVYWPEATHLVYPPLFAEMAADIASSEAPPLWLWLDLRVFLNDDGTSGLFTTGMRPLGFMEIEIPRIEMQPGELREWVLDIVSYLIENGPVLNDGDTIGAAEEQRILVRHRPSQFGHEGNVLCLLCDSGS